VFVSQHLRTGLISQQGTVLIRQQGTVLIRQQGTVLIRQQGTVFVSQYSQFVGAAISYILCRACLGALARIRQTW
jgi:hypothetical protein